METEFNTIDDLLNSKNLFYYISSGTGKMYKSGTDGKCNLLILTVGGVKDLFKKWEN